MWEPPNAGLKRTLQRRGKTSMSDSPKRTYTEEELEKMKEERFTYPPTKIMFGEEVVYDEAAGGEVSSTNDAKLKRFIKRRKRT